MPSTRPSRQWAAVATRVGDTRTPEQDQEEPPPQPVTEAMDGGAAAAGVVPMQVKTSEKRIIRFMWRIYVPAALFVTAALGAAVPAQAEPPPRWNPAIAAARDYVSERGGNVSFAVRTERRVYGHQRLRSVPSASVLKAMLLVTYLNHRSVRQRALTKRDRGLITPMIRWSDNSSASAIRNFVGSRGLRRLARRVGMKRFVPVAHPWGHSLVNAADQTRFFLTIDRFVVKRHRRTAMRLLASVVRSQRWGVGRVKPRGWELYFKGGWGSGSGAVDHQVALLKKGPYRVSVAVMTTSNGSHAYGKQTLRGVFRRLLSGLGRVKASTGA